MIQSTLIPVNIEGKQNNLSCPRELSSHKLAAECYIEACTRMLSPFIWHKLFGALGASVALIDKTGNEVANRLAQADDYMRIDIPGPGPVAGHGYDWVRIEAIENRQEGDEAICGMRARPAAPPASDNNNIAHFFQPTSTSTFIIHKSGNIVTAHYHGRNEKANAETGITIDNIRNTIVASGAIVGLSEAQWTGLIEAFVNSNQLPAGKER
jgi:hypothetical protein